MLTFVLIFIGGMLFQIAIFRALPEKYQKKILEWFIDVTEK